MIASLYRLDCDGVNCGKNEFIGAQVGQSQITSEIMRRGWKSLKGGKLLCPDCIKSRNTIKPS